MKTLAAAIQAADHLARQTGKNYHVIKGKPVGIVLIDPDGSAYVGSSHGSYLAISRERLHSRLPGLTEGSPELLHSTKAAHREKETA